MDKKIKEKREEYIKFMYDLRNELNCDACPENQDMVFKKYPCGQQNCWVTCHCYPERFENH